MTSLPWYDKNDTVENNKRAKKAYTAMLTVTPKQPNDDAYTKVSNEVSVGRQQRKCSNLHRNGIARGWRTEGDNNSGNSGRFCSLFWPYRFWIPFFFLPAYAYSIAAHVLTASLFCIWTCTYVCLPYNCKHVFVTITATTMSTETNNTPSDSQVEGIC